MLHREGPVAWTGAPGGVLARGRKGVRGGESAHNAIRRTVRTASDAEGHRRRSSYIWAGAGTAALPAPAPSRRPASPSARRPASPAPARRKLCPPPPGALPVRRRAPCGIVVITVNFAAVTAKKAGDFRGVATQVALRIGVRGQRWPRSRMASTIPVRSCGPRSRRETRCHMCSSTPRARTPSKRAGSLAHSCCAAVTGVHTRCAKRCPPDGRVR